MNDKIAAILSKVSKKEDLTVIEVKDIMDLMMAGMMSDDQIETFLVSLSKKGFTALEVASAAGALKRNAVQFPEQFTDLLDTCGTGGDGLKTVNISTLSALTACTAGVRVAKHGNRSVSGLFGSADLLEYLGIKLDLVPEKAAACLRKTGFVFLFAPFYHPAVKAASAARKKIKEKTLFNVLGPLVNPANAPFQLVGVYDEKLVEITVLALKKMGCVRGMVVHGMDGLDEISVSRETKIAQLNNGEITSYKCVPEDFGLKREPLENIQCLTPQAAKEAANQVLSGDNSAYSKIVALNAGAALYLAGKARSIKEGLLTAMGTLQSGAVQKKVKMIADFTQTK